MLNSRSFCYLLFVVVVSDGCRASCLVFSLFFLFLGGWLLRSHHLLFLLFLTRGLVICDQVDGVVVLRGKAFFLVAVCYTRHLRV